MKLSRRKSIQQIGKGLVATGLFGLSGALSSCKGELKGGESGTKVTNKIEEELFFKISLAQWSLHKSFFGDALSKGFGPFVQALRKDPDSLLRGSLNPVDFPSIAKNQFDIDAIEYVNTFYFSKAGKMDFWKDIKDRCDSEGVKSVLIMCDALGDLGNLDDSQRAAAVENHYPWVDIAKFLGCHAIRVNAAGSGTAEEVKAAAVDGLGSLSEYGAKNEINIIVENHGGYSSDGKWLASVMTQINNSYCGTLPDFGNFCLKYDENFKCISEYDPYIGLTELMPFAKGVSAKTHEFDEDGNETSLDYLRLLKIVKDAGYSGYIDVEYEGPTLSEIDGIIATKSLLERVGKELS